MPKRLSKTCPKVLIRTFGCQMNDRDSELVAGMLVTRGFALAQSVDEADIILFNTCSVREHAEEKVWSEIGQLKCPKDAKRKIVPRPSEEQRDERSSLVPRKVIGLIGCMAENYKEQAFKRSALIDLVVGPNDIASLPDLLQGVLAERGQRIAVGRAQRDPEVYNTAYLNESTHANVIIMEGCDNYCAYCIVPHVRGRERSRAVEEILREIRALVDKGVKEITLLGQNVNSYRGILLCSASFGGQAMDPPKCGGASEGRGTSFVDLIKMVNEIEGLEKFDFVTSHPKDATEELFRAMTELPKCRKFLHLPVQSGSDRILKLMNRGYTRAQYIALAQKARELIPGLRLTTDVMVGFPEETEKDFQDTFDLMKDVRFEAAYIFKYSPRPHTAAAKWPDDVSTAEKKRRNQMLLDYQKQSHAKMKVESRE